MHKGYLVTGQRVGTGAALTVALGFVPSKVTLYNATKASILNYTKEMPAGAGIKTVTAGTTTLITTGGITPFAGTEGDAVAGFTIGTDAAVNAEGDVIYYEAYSTDA